eukprot:PhM_4_TR10403/c0_g2_i2/m.21590/K08964/mtnB; methylthioribulose-1-phosphate dehydratase
MSGSLESISQLTSTTDDPRVVIVQLCRLFYSLGWATGTGGGVSVRRGSHVYVAPSAVQKEMIHPDDIFVLDVNDMSKVVSVPKSLTVNQLKLSECTPLFYNAFVLRDAGACLHSHSIWSVLITSLFPQKDEFVVTELEMMKGIPGVGFYDTLRIPIIENTARESELTERMAHAMDRYPTSYCVLVRSHGCYVWGPTWQRAKGIAEC